MIWRFIAFFEIIVQRHILHLFNKAFIRSHDKPNEDYEKDKENDE
jgi:hypothetical protein